VKTNVVNIDYRPPVKTKVPLETGAQRLIIATCEKGTVENIEEMRQVKGKDTAPELAVRRLLTRMGLRYRLHRADLPGKPDIVMPGRRLAIFVHGCFWHGHDCPRGALTPKSNRPVHRFPTVPAPTHLGQEHFPDPF